MHVKAADGAVVEEAGRLEDRLVRISRSLLRLFVRLRLLTVFLLAVFIQWLTWTVFGTKSVWPQLCIVLLTALGYGYFVHRIAAKSTFRQFAKDYDFDPRRLDRLPADPIIAALCAAADEVSSDARSREQDEHAATQALYQAIVGSNVAQSAKVRSEFLAEVGRITGWSQGNDDRRLNRITAVLDKLQERIGGEYTDIAYRTGWLMTAQAFLLSAYVATANSELVASTRVLLTVSVAAIGMVTSLVLTAAIFFGHALIERLKTTRDVVEQLMHRDYGVPRTGAGRDTEVHRWGHFATKTLPCFAFAVWTMLAVVASDGIEKEHREQASPVSLLFQPPPLQEQPTALKQLEPSPWFAVGSADFRDDVNGCGAGEEKKAEADAWIAKTVAAWRARPRPSGLDIVVLIGATDRQRLDGAARERFDSNIGLATARAEHVRNALIAATNAADFDPVHKLTPERIFVQVRGARYTPEVGAGGSTSFSCDSPPGQRDRMVEVWIPVRANT